MGHLTGKDIYRELGDKLDSLPFRVNKNRALFNILKELYTSEEAELVVKMPHVLSHAVQIEKSTGFERNRLNSLLENSQGSTVGQHFPGVPVADDALGGQVI